MSTTRKLTLKSCAVRGPAGKSAYEAAVAEGYTGTAAEYNALVASLPDAFTRLNTYNGRVDAILEYFGTQISMLQNELAQALEIARNPAFPEEGTNAHVVPKLETLTGNVKVLYLNGNNPDGLPHTFTPVIRNVAAPQLEGDAANKAYVDNAIAALPSSQQTLIVSGWADNSDTSQFTISSLSDAAFTKIQNAVSQGTCIPVFKLIGPPVGLTRFLPITHCESSYAQFSLPKLGTTGEGLLVRVTASGASGTKY